MRRNNINLHKVGKAKNDEFYTRYEDIENEVQHYAAELKGQWIYCPCDDYEWSNFVKYFKNNFSRYELKHLTATHIHLDGTPSERYDYDGVNESITMLNGNGDFRSEECSRIKDAADIVITNPPFSLFSEFINWLKRDQDIIKKFLIIAPINSFLYKSVFEYIRTGKIWAGTKGAVGVVFDTCKLGKVAKVTVDYMTNLNYGFTKPNLNLSKYYNPDDYKKYDNYDAIEVSRCLNIPMDYTGLMGVPITFILYTNYQQFEIFGKISPILNGKNLYGRLIIKNKHPVQIENDVNNMCKG